MSTNGAAPQQATQQQQPAPALPRPQQQQLTPQQQVARQQQAAYYAMIRAAIDMASVRLLGLLGVMGALVIFGYSAYEPTQLRLYMCIAYSACVLWPLVYMYLHKGEPQI